MVASYIMLISKKSQHFFLRVSLNYLTKTFITDKLLQKKKNLNKKQKTGKKMHTYHRSILKFVYRQFYDKYF